MFDRFFTQWRTGNKKISHTDAVELSVKQNHELLQAYFSSNLTIEIHTVKQSNELSESDLITISRDPVAGLKLNEKNAVKSITEDIYEYCLVRFGVQLCDTQSPLENVAVIIRHPFELWHNSHLVKTASIDRDAQRMLNMWYQDKEQSGQK